MPAIDTVPQYELISIRTDWLLKELQFEVKLTKEQYEPIKSCCSIDLTSNKISITDNNTCLTVSTINKLAKLVKLIVHKQSYIGEFVVGFTHLSYKETNNYHGRKED